MGICTNFGSSPLNPTDMKFIIEIIFLAVIFGIAEIQGGMIARQEAIRHFWWALLFGLLIIGAWWLEDRSYWLAGALVLEHFVFFSPALNFCREPHKPFFYLSSEPKTGSLWDSVLLKVQKYYPFIWGAGLIGLGFLQTKL